VEDRVLVATLAACGWVVMLFMAVAVVVQFHVTSDVAAAALGGSLSLLGSWAGAGFGVLLVKKG
jgi:hypothetical protein